MLSCFVENAPPTARYMPFGENATSLTESPPANVIAGAIGAGVVASG